MTLQEALDYLNKVKNIDGHRHELLEQWRKVYYGMSLHTTGACPKFYSLDSNSKTGLGSEVIPAGYFGTEYQNLFNYILFARHPREHELTRQWRFSQYKPITKAPFQQITEIVVGAIFQDSQYDIHIESEEEDKYIWSNSFDGHDLIGWYENVGVPSIMEDPNGLIIRMPQQPYYEAASPKIDLGIYFIKSKDIIYFDGKTLLFCKEGYAYYVDDTVIFRFTYNGKEYELTSEDREGYYAHMLGKLPVDVAGGVWNTQGYYDSFLDKGKARADDYIGSYSAEQMVDKEASHPFIVLANEECGECQGVGKKNIECDDCEGGWELVSCGTCKGKGTVSVSPGDRLYARKEDMQHDLVKIVNPDVAINTYHHDKNKDVYESILEALLLLKVDAAQSGVAKTIDQDNLYKFISKISNHLFDKLIFNTISDIVAYRNIGVIDGVMRPVNTGFRISKPNSFQIKTAADLLAEFKTGAEANVPAFIRTKMISDYVDKQYAGDDVMKKKTSFIMDIDDLATITPDERMSMATFGEASKEELLFSRKLPLILDEIIRDKGTQWFTDAKFDQIKEQVDIKFAPLKASTNFIDLGDDILS